MTAGFGKIKKRIEKVIDWIAIFFFCVIGIIAMAQIIMRYIFNNPFFWSEEFLRLVFVWVCYIGWTLASRNKSHIRIVTVISRLPPMGRKFLETLNSILVILFSIFMIWFGIKMAEVGALNKAVTLPISFTLVYAIVPVSNFIILIYQILDIVDIRKDPKSAAGGITQ
jgi:TRAP-type C4-dicarboxylate transport system permease small subunit